MVLALLLGRTRRIECATCQLSNPAYTACCARFTSRFDPRRRPMRNEPRDELLYDPLDEHDACGVGFVADVSGRATHQIVESALEALCNLTHRGAIDADGKTGDGAGLLTQLPVRFFGREMHRLRQEPEVEPPGGLILSRR